MIDHSEYKSFSASWRWIPLGRRGWSWTIWLALRRSEEHERGGIRTPVGFEYMVRTALQALRVDSWA
jgi:hypothetical protein